MSGSISPPEISFIIEAPKSIVSFAILDLNVSTDRSTSENSFRMISSAGINLFLSSSSETNSAPGLDE